MFRPNYYFNKVTKISPLFLRQQGITTLILDVDNTLTVDHAAKLIPGVADWLVLLQQSGIALIILSNAVPKRMAAFAGAVGLPFVGLGLKPLPFGYFRAMRRVGGSKKHTAIVGDQLFTDILGGKLSGCKTVLVAPQKLETSCRFKIKRALERKLLRRYKLPCEF